MICQRKYTLELVEQTCFLGSKPARSPMEQNMKLAHGDSAPMSDVSEYRRLISKLLYLTITRPNISFAVKQLSQYLDAPTELHLRATHKLLRYLKDTAGQGLFYPSIGKLELKGFADSEWEAVWSLEDQLMDTVCFLVILWYPGRPRSKARCLDRHLKRNIGHWHWQRVKFSGFCIYLVTWE